MRTLGNYRNSWTGVPINIGIILSIYLFLPGISGFSKPYTPDSQFYLSLGIFGDEVTSRSPWPAYFWTKTSLIAPMHFLVDSVGLSNGFTLLKLLFLCILITPTVVFFYKKFQDNFLGLAVTSVVALNSVVITFLGATYSTIIGVVLLITLQIGILNHLNSQENASHIVIGGISLGAILSTLLFGNPTYFVVGSLILLAFIFWLVLYMRTKLLSAFKFLAVGAISFTLITMAWLQVSSKIFPGLNWWETVIFYAKNLNPKDYTSPNQFEIFLSNPSLYFIAAMQIVGLILIWLGPKKVSSSLSISSFFLTFCNAYFVFSAFIIGSNVLEVDFYNAILWAPGLVLFVLFIAETLLKSKHSTAILTTLIVSYISGKTLSGVSDEQVLKVILFLFVITSAFLVFITFVSKKNLKTWISIPMILLFVSTPQILQGSHLYPYGAAYSSYSLKNYFKEFSRAQGYVLDGTNSKDRVMVWVEPKTDLVTFAAGQLWGPNSVSHDTVLSDWDKNNLKASQPTAVASYFVNLLEFEKFQNSLRSSGWNYRNQKCSNFKATEITSRFTICLFSIEES
jgi:hypothetical protein